MGNNEKILTELARKLSITEAVASNLAKALEDGGYKIVSSEVSKNQMRVQPKKGKESPEADTDTDS